MATWVGIDIAAKEFELVSRIDGKSSRPMKFKQTSEGHQRAIEHLRALAPSGVVMEATGVYYLDLAVALFRAGLPVMVINPKSFHHFAKLMLKPSKTDGIGTALLAEYGERMTPARWIPPDTTCLGLRDIGRQINRLTASRTQAKNRLHALQAKGMTLSLLLEDEQEGIALLGELCVLPREMKASQVSRYAGLDVRLNLSGTSVHRPARLSKAGNAYLRAAMSAVRHDARAKAFNDALVGRGKKKIQALCAVMRKYLTGLWACLQLGTPFDSTKLFSDCHQANACN